MTKAGVFEDDFVIVREQASARVGQMVAALLEEGATIKTYGRENERAVLLPASDDPRHQPIDAEGAQVIGTVTAVVRQVRSGEQRTLKGGRGGADGVPGLEGPGRAT